MAALDDLAGLLVEPASTPRFDTGTVVRLDDATHVTVDLGERLATTVLPESLAAAVQVGSFVRVSIQQNSTVLDCVLANMAAPPPPPVIPLLPVGLIGAWIKTSLPTGWLWCEGGSYSSTTYPELYAFLGTTTLPDYRGRVLAGQNAGTFSTLGGTVGAETHTLTVAEMPTHQHNYGDSRSVSQSPAGSGNGTAFNNGNYSTSYSGGNGAHNNIQPSRVVKWIIYAGTPAA